MKLSILLIGALPFLATALPSQTPDNLIGFTRNLPLLRQVDHANCSRLSQCAVPWPGITITPPYAGGTGWDPRRPGAWISDGRLLGKYADDCTPLCTPAMPPTLAPNAFITGLEVVQRLNQIVFVDSQGFIHFYTNTCPPIPVTMCYTGLGPTALGNVTTGLAIDEDQDLVFVAFPIYPVGPNFVAVLRLGNPCQVICQLLVPPCPAGPIGTFTGLACDWGRRILYGTDGNNTVALRYQLTSSVPCPSLLLLSCCQFAAANDPFVGLAIRPGGATRFGHPCNNGLCPNCANQHTLGNDPVLGNADFHLVFDQAPARSLAWALIGAGPCRNSPIITPLLCGPVWSTPLLGSLGPIPTGGITPCSGAAVFAFPLPASATFAGWVLSSQCVTLCATPVGIGTAMSSCLSFELQGS